MTSTDSNITFVSSFINIYDTPFEDKNASWRFDKFRDIAETGIQLCIYVSPDYLELLLDFSKDFSNIKIMKPVTIHETWVSKLCKQCDGLSLPDNRNGAKDTVDYICLMNSKIEFMEDAIMQNPWNSTHFAWLDFSISYIFKNMEASKEMLRILSRRTLAPKFIAMPGCWDRLPRENAAQIVLNNIHWRFCGGFFLGDRDSILNFYDLYQTHFANFVFEHKKLIWEVNFWAWLEATTEWRPVWYRGDHNDSILHISADVCSMSLRHLSTESTYDYPTFDTYEICQAAYLNYKGKHMLNTRYVNYWVMPSGHYQVKHPEGRIITRNIYSELKDDDFTPMCYSEMTDPGDDQLPSSDCKFLGLEDIRLYEFEGAVKFIATSINYSPTGRNRMIVGNYCADTLTYSNCRVIEPPSDSWCEKNWIPVIQRDSDGKSVEKFIYKWSPMEIGRIVTEGTGEGTSKRKLEIETTYPIKAPYFNRVRGSSVFIEWGEFLLGIVHYCEDIVPRHYFHMLVMLDKKTMKPLKYSESFYFEKIGIEFCIGMTIRDSDYYFWISKFDRDPTLVRISMDHIPFCFDF